MKALVTGGAGFIGSHLVDSLLTKGWEVRVLDNFSTGRIENLNQYDPNLEILAGSACSTDIVQMCLSNVQIVYHLAARVGARNVESDPIQTIETNITATSTVIKEAFRKGIPVLVTSTSEVYGKLDKLPYSEDSDLHLGSPFNRRWAYAASKIVDEHLTIAHFGTVVRLFNTIGPRQTGEYGMVVPRFLKQAYAGEPITIYGNGHQKRSFTWVGDVVEALIKLMEFPLYVKPRLFNIGHTEEIEIVDLAKLVKELTHSESKIVYTGNIDPMIRRLPDLTNIEAAIGYKPTKSLTEMIEAIIAYDKSHNI